MDRSEKLKSVLVMVKLFPTALQYQQSTHMCCARLWTYIHHHPMQPYHRRLSEVYLQRVQSVVFAMYPIKLTPVYLFMLSTNPYNCHPLALFPSRMVFIIVWPKYFNYLVLVFLLNISLFCFSPFNTLFLSMKSAPILLYISYIT